MASEGRSGTITEAIIHVLRATQRPMTAAEILESIQHGNLYAFNAKSPGSVVSMQLRRHTQGTQSKIAAKVKLFGRSADGKYYLLS